MSHSKSAYYKRYGVCKKNLQGNEPDYERCAEEVRRNSILGYDQCKRKHLPNSSYCKLHGRDR